jgi:hypothetical protein
MLQLIIDKTPLTLLSGEYLEFHDGRASIPFNLDCSICGIKDSERADELKIVLTELFPFTPYKVEPLQILELKEETPLFEVLFSISDFCPIIKEVI